MLYSTLSTVLLLTLANISTAIPLPNPYGPNPITSPKSGKTYFNKSNLAVLDFNFHPSKPVEGVTIKSIDVILVEFTRRAGPTHVPGGDIALAQGIPFPTDGSDITKTFSLATYCGRYELMAIENQLIGSAGTKKEVKIGNVFVEINCAKD